MFTNINKIRNILDKRRKINLIFVFIILIIVGILETIGIGLILPILSLVFDNSKNLIVINFFDTNFGINDKNYILKITIIVFTIVVILKNILLVTSVWLKEKFLLNMSVYLSTNLFSVYLNKPIIYHVNKNSSELVRNLINEVKIITKSYVLSYINIFSECVFIFTLIILLSLNNFYVTLISFSFLGILSLILLLIHKNKLGKFAEIRLKYSLSTLKVLKESLDSMKEIKVGKLKDTIVRNYFKFANRTGKMNILASLYGSFPKAFLEIMLVVVFAVLLLTFSKEENSITDYLPLVGLYLAAIFKAMPSISRLINNVQSLRYSEPSFTKVYQDLKQKEIKKHKIPLREIKFNNKIEFNGLSFYYEEEKKVVDDVNFKIKKNSITGIIGKTGSGKTTLLDLILGLLKKKKGKIIIDESEIDLYDNFDNWVNKISYAPQSVYIYDDSIEKNITLSDDKTSIDYKLLKKAIAVSQLEKFIENSPNKLDTILGELGEKISGGQKQRVGIARAIYKNSSIIILDECTNALDENTEKQIISEIKKLKSEKTIIFVSHNLNIVENISDKIIQINEGKIKIIEKNK